jgi:hypothetical protein
MPNAGDYVRAGDTTRYFCKATQSSVQSIPNNAFTAITFNGTDDVDNLGIHDPVTNNSQFVIGLKLGWWQVSGKYATTGSAAGTSRRSRFLLNGATSINGSYTSFPAFSATAMTGGFWTTESTTLVQTTLSTDYIEFTALQDSGGALNTTVSGDLRCQFTAIYLGTGT